MHVQQKLLELWIDHQLPYNKYSIIGMEGPRLWVLVNSFLELFAKVIRRCPTRVFFYSPLIRFLKCLLGRGLLDIRDRAGFRIGSDTKNCAQASRSSPVRAPTPRSVIVRSALLA
jgi:hypothetical protein